MKKIISIFLFIIICVSHLNIVNAVVDFSVRYKKENTQTSKNIPADEESQSEKDCKGKEKSEEQEKFYTSHYSNNQFQLSDKDKFVCFNTSLNIHPCRDKEIRPPKAA